MDRLAHKGILRVFRPRPIPLHLPNATPSPLKAHLLQRPAIVVDLREAEVGLRIVRRIGFPSS